MVEMLGFDTRKTGYLNQVYTWPHLDTMSLIRDKALSKQVGIREFNRKFKRVKITWNKEVRNMDRTKNARKRISFNQIAPYKGFSRVFNYQSLVSHLRVDNRISFLNPP